VVAVSLKKKDVATVLWERDLPHLKVVLADPVETIAWRSETTALPGGDVATHRQVLEALHVEADAYVARDDSVAHDDVSCLALDRDVAHVLAGKVKMDGADAATRMLRIVTSLADLPESPWTQAALVQLGASAVIGGRPEQVADYDEMLGEGPEQNESSLVRRATLRTALIAWTMPEGGFAPESVHAFVELLDGLPGDAVSDAIYGFGSLRWSPGIEPAALAAQHSVATALYAWILEHAGQAHAGEALGWAPYVSPAFAARWVKLIAKLGGKVLELRAVDAKPLRMAVDLFVGTDQDAAQVAQTIDGNDEAIRAAALDAICTYDKPWCFGALARVVASPRLLRLAESDRRRVMSAGMRIAPRDAELVLFDLVKKTTLLGSSGEHHATRLLAIDVLSELATSTEAQLELDRLVQAQRGVPEDVRAAAQRALAAIRERRQSGAHPNPFGVR